MHPTRAALVPAIDAAAPTVVKDRLLDLHLDQLALFLDHHDQLQPLGPVVKALHVQREGLPDLVGGQAKALCLALVNPQKVQRMDEVEPVLAGGDEPDLRARLAPDAAVHAVGMGKRLGCETLEVDHPRFLRDGRVGQANVQPAVRHREIGRLEGKAERIAIDDRRRLDRVLHRLEADPDPGKAAERPAVKPVIHDLLHAGGADDRHIGVDHRPVGLMQHGGAFAGVVVPHRHQHAAMARGACHVGMAHHVAGTVHPRPLAVPEREDTVIFALAPQLRLLAAPDRGGGKVFVQARLKADVVGVKQLACLRHVQIDPAQRRSAIAGDVACGIQTGLRVPRLLHQHQPHKRLGPVQQDRRAVKIVAVVQRNLVLGHRRPPSPSPIIGQKC